MSDFLSAGVVATVVGIYLLWASSPRKEAPYVGARSSAAIEAETARVLARLELAAREPASRDAGDVPQALRRDANLIADVPDVGVRVRRRT